MVNEDTTRPSVSPLKRIFAKTIKRRRKAFGISPALMAARLGMTRENYYKLESPNHPQLPTLENLMVFHRTLKMSLDEMFCLHDLDDDTVDLSVNELALDIVTAGRDFERLVRQMLGLYLETRTGKRRR